MKNNVRKILRLTISSTLLIGLFAFLEHLGEHWTGVQVLFIAGSCIVLGVIMAFVSLLISKLVSKLPQRPADDSKQNRPGLLLDKTIDFLTTAAFLTFINYHYLAKVIMLFRLLWVDIAVAAAGAFILAMYRVRIKSWAKRVFKFS